MNKGTDYTISVPGNSCKDGCTFEVVFDNSFLSTVGTSDKLVIRYDTKLNDHAIISGEGNSNEAYISYGNNFTTEHDKTTTYTYLFDIVKIDGYTKGLLDGAEFALSYKNNILDEDGQVIEADVIPLVYMDEISEESGIPTYHIANGNMTDEHEPVDRIVATGGKARIVGLDAAVYYLTETQAPAGFNKLSSSHQVAVDDQHNWVAYGEDGQPAENSGVIIENNSGTELPSTGAKGTAMFISFGMFMVICTGLLLVTKKRMSMIQE